MGFSEMRVYVAKNLPEQSTRDCVKSTGASPTCNLPKPQKGLGATQHEYELAF